MFAQGKFKFFLIVPQEILKTFVVYLLHKYVKPIQYGVSSKFPFHNKTENKHATHIQLGS
jgi:hypothetical protein